jgi:hypothetical protein
MVHPPSGYMVGKALRRAPEVAQAIARALGAAGATPHSAARARMAGRSGRQRACVAGSCYLFGLAKPDALRQRNNPGIFRTFFQSAAS